MNYLTKHPEEKENLIKDLKRLAEEIDTFAEMIGKVMDIENVKELEEKIREERTFKQIEFCRICEQLFDAPTQELRTQYQADTAFNDWVFDLCEQGIYVD